MEDLNEYIAKLRANCKIYNANSTKVQSEPSLRWPSAEYSAPEEKIICPYNNSHHIRRCRMSVHLVKCKKNYPDQDMATCSFNATHIIRTSEVQYHEKNCPDRRKIEAQIVESVSRRNKFPVANITVESDENWDDLNCPTYDPKPYVEKNDILRHMDVESSAKKKNFQMQERLRLSALKDQTRPLPVSAVKEANKPELPQDDIRVKLPQHRDITNVQETTPSASLRQKLKLGANKMFVPE